MKYMKTILITLAVVLLLLFIAGCTYSIAKIKKPENVGKTVLVRGTVENPIKLGQLSGYTLVDRNGDKISVSSETMPKEGSTVTVKGVLIKDTLLGYYIKAD